LISDEYREFISYLLETGNAGRVLSHGYETFKRGGEERKNRASFQYIGKKGCLSFVPKPLKEREKKNPVQFPFSWLKKGCITYLNEEVYA